MALRVRVEIESLASSAGLGAASGGEVFGAQAAVNRSRKRFSSISFAANNLLNNKNMISGGFEQSRFDYETKDPTVFPNKYFYLQGINYNLSLNISLWKQ